jgi:hypothetical protein
VTVNGPDIAYIHVPRCLLTTAVFLKSYYTALLLLLLLLLLLYYNNNMPSPTLLSVLALAIAAPSLAVANPPGRPGWSFPSPASWSWGGGGWGKPPGAPAWAPVPPTPTACVTDAQATVIANQFAQLISNYSVALADAVLAENYFDQADSVNTLIDGGTEMPLAVCVVFVFMFSPFGLSVCCKC